MSTSLTRICPACKRHTICQKHVDTIKCTFCGYEAPGCISLDVQTSLHIAQQLNAEIVALLSKWDAHPNAFGFVCEFAEVAKKLRQLSAKLTEAGEIAMSTEQK